MVIDLYDDLAHRSVQVQFDLIKDGMLHVPLGGKGIAVRDFIPAPIVPSSDWMDDPWGDAR